MGIGKWDGEGEESERGEVSKGPVCGRGGWHRGGVGEKPGRGRALEARLFLLLGADLALRDFSTCESPPSTASLPRVGRQGMFALVPKDLSGGSL